MIERTLVFIKPEHVEWEPWIFSELDLYGERVKTVRVDSVPRGIIEAHYKEHEQKPFYDTIVDHFADKPVVLAVYEGENIIQTIRDVIGPTEPTPDTLRGKYSCDTLEKSAAENRSVANVIHASDSQYSADYEMEVWNDYLKLCDLK